MKVGKRADQSQTESGAAVRTRIAIVDLFERIEDAIDLRCRNTATGILDHKVDAAHRWLELYQHAAAGIGELDGVGNEIERDLTKRTLVDIDSRHALIERRRQRHAFGLRSLQVDAHARLRKAPAIRPMPIELEFPGFDLRDVEQIVDQTEQMRAARQDIACVLAIVISSVGAEGLG